MSKCERGQNQNEKPLKLENLHPTLQFIFDMSEVRPVLYESIKAEGEEKIVLNLTNKVNKYAIKTEKKEFDFTVNFGVRKDRKIINDLCLSVVLDNIESKEAGVKELGIIAQDLQKIYNLPYEPEIFYHGDRVKLPKK